MPDRPHGGRRHQQESLRHDYVANHNQGRDGGK